MMCMTQAGRRKVESYRSLTAVAASLNPQINGLQTEMSFKRFEIRKNMNADISLPFQICCSINKAFYKLRNLTMSCDRRPCSESL